MKAALLSALLLAAPLSAQPALDEAELFRRIESHVDSLAKADRFSGVVLLARNGKPVFERAWGFADREAKRPNTVETAFNIGSINKLFTTIAIRQLEAAGKLHLDSTLARAWPDYPNPDVARRVTIRQMLGHRAGISGNIFAAPAGKSRHDVRHNNDFLPLIVNEPLAFEPGARQQYSNAGFVLLGMLVERLSGKDYYEYVRENVYAPAGMARTAAYPVDALPPNTAIGYTGTPGARERNTASLPGRGSAAGGGYSTPHDLVRFLQALRGGKIANGPPAGSVGIAGGAPGLNAIMEGDLPGGYDLVVMANMDPPAANQVGRAIRGWLGSPD
ncbi:MAG TPA: serine hydrolase domain-containing protein [Gemmatimonadaceae bacterium]|nr:serine hydrolase domain-containing protein [Gemmatimonadaceae bacterium]